MDYQSYGQTTISGGVGRAIGLDRASVATSAPYSRRSATVSSVHCKPGRVSPKNLDMAKRSLPTHTEIRARVRRDFDRRRRKCRLTFSEIRMRLLRGDTLGSIASSAGVARSRMRIVYDQWFRRTLHLPKANERRRRQLQEKRTLTREGLRRLPPRDSVRVVAEQEGYQFVKPVPRDQRTRAGQVRLREVYIHGRLCGVHHLRSAYRQAGRHAVYACTTLSLSSVERQEFKTFYIQTRYGTTRIDRERGELLALFKRPGQRTATIYLPLR